MNSKLTIFFFLGISAIYCILFFSSNPNSTVARNFRHFYSAFIESDSDGTKEFEWMKNMEAKYKKINKRIRRTCKNFGNPRRAHIHKPPQHDSHHKLAACTNSKVASSSWWKHFVFLLPKHAKEIIKQRHNATIPFIYENFLSITKNQSSEMQTNLLRPKHLNKFLKENEYLTFTFVRHPFERLVSAYKDLSSIIPKDGRKTGFHWKNGKMMSGYGGYKKWYDKDPSFEAFVKLVLEEYKSYCPSKLENIGPKCQGKLYESECEFEINPHWRPYSSSCSMCHIKYDVIGHLETFNDDMRYIIQKSKIEIKDAYIAIHSTKQSTKMLTKKYFSRLDSKIVSELYQMFQMDFEMFDYDINSYIK